MKNNIDALINSLHNKKTKTYIVHSIGTDCGKTHTVCSIVKKLNEKIKENFVIKPLVSGFDVKNFEESDNFKLLYAKLGSKPSLSETMEISRYIFINPLSPDIASWKENIEVDFNAIISFCKQWIENANNSDGKLFIETAGGVCSPCSNFHTMADISKCLASENVENILVTTPYLGAISHTISALQVLKFDILIINRSEENFVQSIQNHLPYGLQVVVN